MSGAFSYHCFIVCSCEQVVPSYPHHGTHLIGAEPPPQEY